MKRWSVFGLLLACATLLALIWLLDGEERKSTADHDRRASGSPESAANLSLEDEVAAFAPVDRVSVAAPVTDETLPVSAGTTDELELRVLLHETGEPVSSADVFVLPLDSGSAQVSFYSNPLHALDEAVAKGTHYRSDAEGRVALPLTARKALVYAEHERCAGFVHLGSESALSSEVFLYEDASLTVQVVDEAGTPRAGIDVALACEGDSRYPDLVGSAVTAGEDGTAILTRVGMLMATSSGSLVSVRIQALLEPPVECRVDASILARGRVVLVLPATGEVELLVQDDQGGVSTDPLDVQVWVESLDRGSHPNRVAAPSWLRRVTGRMLVPRVGLGTRVFARTTLRDGRTIQGHASGPMVAGERTTLVLDLGSASSWPVIEGRLLDEHGVPIVEAWAMITVAKGTPLKNTSLWSARTDARGIFRQVAPLANDPPGSVRLFVALQDDDSSIGDSAVVDLVVPLPRETIRLGDLVLREGPSICAGRVVDGEGRPIADAELSLMTKGRYLGLNPWLLRGRSDADGRFAIRGILETSILYVVARAPKFGETVLEIPPGKQDVLLVLEAAARIVGSIAPSNVFRMDELSVDCMATRIVSNRAFSIRVRPAHGSGAFQLTGLPAGEFRIQLTTHPMVGNPLELATVQVEAGAVLRDPRLQSFDVDGRLHRFEIVPSEPDGRGLLIFAVSARLPNTEADSEVYSDIYDGRMRIASTSAEIDVLVSALGRRSVAAICTPGVTKVTMPPALEVRLEIDGVADLLGATYGLVPRLDFHGREERAENWDGLTFDAQGVCQFSVANAGAHEVRYSLRKDSALTVESFASDPVQTVEVRDTTELQTFDVHLPREVLEKVLATPRK